MVILTEGEDLEFDQEHLARLARLGVTSVSVVSGRRARGIVLHGWAFDARGSADEATEIISTSEARFDVLMPQLELAVRKMSVND